MLEYQKSPEPGTARRAGNGFDLRRNEHPRRLQARERGGDGAISGTPA
jgi:hypothetical protein